MPTADTYPPPLEQEQLAIWLGFFRPIAPPTDAQRMEAAQKVEGRVEFKRSAYWMHLEKIIERDQIKQSQICNVCWRLYGRQQLRKPARKPQKHHRWHCDTPRVIVLIVQP